uniref:UDP-glucuronosyltransferase n=1 Tax=Photinus pyralis TaxID=7054 RepID=A0A1Y1NF76_PHOPY
MQTYFKAFLFILFIYKCNSARILGICHIPAHSHQQLGTALLTGLAEKGHEVTMVTPVAPKKSVKNLKIIQLKYPPLHENKQLNMFDMKAKTIFEKILFMEILGLRVTDLVLNLTEIQTLLSEDQHFDAVIIEQFVNEAFRGFCYRFGAPCIGLSTVAPNRWTNRQMGNPFNPAYVTELFLGYSDRMTFFQRLTNAVVITWEMLLNHFYVLPKHNELLQKYFPGAPHLYELYFNTSLMLLNAHVATNAPVPLVPNMIPIGGYHIKPPNKLPTDLQEYLDDAKEGAVYFSMGSNLNSANMTKDRINALLRVFGGLKQKVLWKLDNNSLLHLPPNVKLSAWFPQQEILAHPNLKLFITHGGLLSTMEAIYHGVPIVAIPIFGDQEMNAANAENGGYAAVVPYEQLNEDNLRHAVNEVLKNPRYRNNALQRSKILRDEPIPPLDKAVFWVEYVIRHNGAPHLRTAALNLHWYQYLLLDVALFVIVVTLSIVFMFKKLINVLCRKSRSSKETKKNSKQKTN